MDTKVLTTDPDPKSPKPLLGRVALVTGGSRGLGAAIARELADSGATVVVNYHHGGELAAGVVAEIEAAGGSAFTEQCNVADYDEVGAMFERIKARTGRFDILVNNAAIVRDHSFKKMTVKEWRDVIDTDLTALMYTCHFAVPLLLENGWGRIINISSTTGQLVITFGQANYAAAKAGIIGFSKALAIELARNNITVNVVAPGAMATEMWDTIPDAVKEKIYEKIPLHRAVTPEEVARGVRFLAVDGAYITGFSLNMNGGLYQG
ncbi:MAG: 3-oxoacyl-ACP reductase FabG [Candidatus Baltobacteraceae bacterium]|jgi:acetoacetyl-CoA reductase